MYWYSFLSISVAILGIALIDAIAVLFFRYKRNRILTPNRSLILGTWASASIMFYPLYLRELEGTVGVVEYIRAGLVSIQHSIRIFAFDGDYMNIVEMSEGLEPDVQIFYTLLGAILYLVAPILTVGLILSFFKNLTSYIYYIFSFWKHTHVFSELNEKSLALAKSVNDVNNKKDKRKYNFWKNALIVFTDVTLKDDEKNLELLEEAREIGAILFTKDLESIRYRNRHFSIRKVSFYLISDDEGEKIRHAESIIAEYKYIKHTKLYLFSNSIESKSFFDSYTKEDKENMHLEVVRVNDIRALIYNNLNDNGIKLFEEANELTDGTREISAVIVGLGQYGMEMLKALLWYCQLPGYKVNITAFDDREEVESIFKASCPEIRVAESVNASGDMRYTLNIKKAKYGTQEFYDEVVKLNVWEVDNGVKRLKNKITYLFVCLGSDGDNIAASKGIRNWLAKEVDILPRIETVIYDSSLKDRIVEDFYKQNINIIGDLEAFYSEGTVINSKLANDGLEVHKRWDESENPNNNYYMNDYNYYSSLASALHRNLRKMIIKHKKNNIVFPFYCKYTVEEKKLFQIINDNEEIKKLSNEMTEFADYLYIKLAQVHYKKLKPEERKKVLDVLECYMSENVISLNIPMFADKNTYIEGYESYIQSFENKDKKKVMRKLFDVIVETKTSNVQNEAERRRLIHLLEYDSLSLEADKLLICEYIRSQIGKEDNDAFYLNEYFGKARQFAQIEHVQWNAYVRTEGFRRTDNSGKKYRKYKMHYNLVPVELLTFADCIKDI